MGKSGSTGRDPRDAIEDGGARSTTFGMGLGAISTVGGSGLGAISLGAAIALRVAASLGVAIWLTGGTARNDASTPSFTGAAGATGGGDGEGSAPRGAFEPRVRAGFAASPGDAGGGAGGSQPPASPKSGSVY